MQTNNLLKQSLLGAALLGGMGCGLPVQAQKPPANAKSAKIKPVPDMLLFVAGAVKRVGPVTIAENATLSEVLSHVVWTAEADLSQVRIMRREIVNGKMETTTQVFNFDIYMKTLQGRLPNRDTSPVIRNNDRVFVGYRVQVNPKDLLK